MDQHRPTCSPIDIPHNTAAHTAATRLPPLPQDRGSQRQRSGHSGYAMPRARSGLFRHNMPARIAGIGIKKIIVISCRPRVVVTVGLQYLKYTVMDFAWAERWRGESEAAAGGSSGGLEASGVKGEDRAGARRQAWSKGLGKMGR